MLKRLFKPYHRLSLTAGRYLLELDRLSRGVDPLMLNVIAPKKRTELVDRHWLEALASLERTRAGVRRYDWRSRLVSDKYGAFVQARARRMLASSADDRLAFRLNILDRLVAAFIASRSAARISDQQLDLRGILRISQRDELRYAKDYLDSESPAIADLKQAYTEFSQSCDQIHALARHAMNEFYILAKELGAMAYGRDEIPSGIEEAFLYPHQKTCLSRAADLRAELTLSQLTFPTELLWQIEAATDDFVLGNEDHPGVRKMLATQRQLELTYRAAVNRLHLAVDDSF